jgi:hypothetical protein
MINKINKLVKEREKLLYELLKCAEMIRGSLVETKKKCGRKDCECTKGKLHPHRYLSFSEKGKNSIVYVMNSEKKRFQKGLRDYEKAWKTICSISEINIKLIKEEHKNAKTR